jgi:trimeric autotransporter adhesin
MELVEDRVLLSSIDLRSVKGAADAQVFRVKKSAVLITSVSGGGVKGGAGVLTATLTSQGIPLAGKMIYFQVRGVPTGKAITDGNGVAMRYMAHLRNVAVGSYARGVGAGFAGDSTHKSTIVHGRLIVSRLPGTISGVSASGVYGGVGTIAATMTSRGAAVAGQTIQFQVMGHIVGSATTDSQGVATLGNVSLAGLRAGAYANAVSASFVGSFTYTASNTPGLLVVAPAPLGVSGITAHNKTYDGTTAATLETSGAALVGVIPGDTVTLNSSGATGTFATKNAGTGITVTVSGLLLEGADVANYSLAAPTTTANITPAAIDVIGVTAANKTYDGTTEATLNTSAATLEGVVPGDTVTLLTSGATGSFATAHVGAGITVIVSGLLLTGADAGNYSLSQPTTTADITPAALNVNGITAANKTYDRTTAATLDTSAATLLGVVPGDSVMLVTGGATGIFATPNVGTGITVIVSSLLLTGADAGNYSLTEPTTTANITPATLDVNGITAANKTYDRTTAAMLNTSGATLLGVISGDVVTLVTSGAVGSFATPNVGTGITVIVSGLLLSGADAGNYALTEPTTTANIKPATVDVNGVTAANKTYDGTTAAALDTSGAVLVGVVPGDTVTLDTSGAVGTFTTPNVGADITVIVSGLLLSGADAGNYTLMEPLTTADITPRALDVSGITADDKMFDDTTDATLDTSGAMLMGVVPSDDVTLDTSGAVGTFASVGPDTNIPVTISGLVITGADSGNYLLIQPMTTANIT